MRRAMGAALLAGALVLTMGADGGCEGRGERVARSKMGPGEHRVTETRDGIWRAPGGTGCRWLVLPRDGRVTKRGGGKRTQYVLLNHEQHKTFVSEKCGVWSK
jgi:hypothetical protein